MFTKAYRKQPLIILLAYSLSFVSFYSKSQDLTLRFEHLTSENGLPQNTIHGIVKDKYGFMWFGTWSGICKYDGYKFTTYRSDPHKLNTISNNRVHSLFKDSSEVIWIQTYDEENVCRYNYETDDFTRVPQSKVALYIKESLDRRNHYEHINFVTNNFKWEINKYNKLLTQTHIPTGKETIYKSNPSNRWSLNDEYAADLYLDNHKILWVGTYSNGINKANINFKPFTYYYHDVQNENSIIDNNIRAICEDDSGRIWIGTRDNGITMIDRKRNKFTHYTHSEKDNNTIIDDQIRKIYEDSKGYIWMGTKRGLSRFDPIKKQFRHYMAPDISSNSVFWIMEDRKKNLWIGTWRGISKLDRKNDKFIYYNINSILMRRYVRVILEDKNNHLWVGTEGGGLTLLKRKPYGEINETVEPLCNYVNSPTDPYSLSDDRIYCILEEENGYIWVGTGNGLNRFDPRTNKFRRFSIKDGLADGMITGILKDAKGYLWISHKRGLSRMDTKTLTVRNFTFHDGLQSNEFSEDAFFKSRKTGEMFFGGNNGFNSFFPDSIREESHLPQIVFTDLQILNRSVQINQEVNGHVVLSKSLTQTKEISLSYKDKSIAIEFAALHYSNPDGNKYAYMLEGFDKDWIYTDASKRIASYSNLEPKSYVFKVRASNSDGLWNPVPVTLDIIVTPPFWQTIWAYIIYALVVLLLLYMFYIYSVKIAKLKNKLSYEALIREKEYELHQNKLQFFTYISHEIKTPLTLILSPIENLLHLVKGNTGIQEQLMMMKRNGDRLLKLINQLLDFRKIETGNVELQAAENDIVKFLKDISLSFEQFAKQKNVAFEFITSEDSIIVWFDPDKLEKIVFNLLSNAFKFTDEKGKVELKVDALRKKEGEGKVLIQVIDTGKGIPAERIELIFKPFQHYNEKLEGTGLGLSYTKSLVELHGGAITVESRLATNNKTGYTSFSVMLPLGVRHLKHAQKAADPKNSDDVSLYIRNEEIAMDILSGGEKYEDVFQDDLGIYDLQIDKILKKQEAPFLIDGKSPILLIVEDNDDLRAYLSNYFRGLLYTVHEAEDGEKGIDVAMNLIPDIIISDVMMPGKNGIELCKILKSDIHTSHVPIVLLTARTPVNFKIEGFEIGADDYITKPFNLRLLDIRVKNLLLSRIKLRERFKTEFSLQPSSVPATSPDEKFMGKILQYIEERISDPELNVEEICKEIGLSRTHLYRKIKSLTGLSMAEVIRNFRLKRAVQLLEQEKLNINEIAYMVGFLDIDYFRKCFKAEFGYTPSEYQKNILKGNIKTSLNE